MANPLHTSRERALRPGWIELDEKALSRNVKWLRSAIGRDVKIFHVCKGDGYGLGIRRVVRLGLAAGVDAFCVGSPEEAFEVRSIAPNAQVLLFASTVPEALPEIASQGVTVTVNSLEALNAIIDASISCEFFFEMDCGFGRFGIGNHADLRTALERYNSQTMCKCVGIYTHLGKPSGDEMLDDWVSRFDAFIDIARQALSHDIITMAASSNIIMYRPKLHYSAIDVGRTIYGITEGVCPDSFKPSLVLKSVKARLIQIHDIHDGSKMNIGYGAEANLIPSGGRVGVFPIGWWDGMGTKQRSGYVLVGGRRVGIIARTLMHTIVNLSGHDDAKVGDEVVLVGSQGDEEITLAMSAEMNGVSASEMHLRIASSMVIKD